MNEAIKTIKLIMFKLTTPPARKVKFLLVDPNKINIDYLGRICGHFPWFIITSHNQEEPIKVVDMDALITQEEYTEILKEMLAKRKI